MDRPASAGLALARRPLFGGEPVAQAPDRLVEPLLDRGLGQGELVGDSLLAPALTRRLIAARVGRTATAGDATLDALTPREREVFRLLARGLSNAEIAAELVVSDATVKTHVASVLSKLSLRDRVQAVILAYESGAVQADETASDALR